MSALHRIVASEEAFENAARTRAGLLPLSAAFVRELPRPGVGLRFWRGAAFGVALTLAAVAMIVWAALR